MWKIKEAVVAASMLSVVAAVLCSTPAAKAGGLRLIAHDGQFLGEVSCSGSKAIGNAYSTYGSKYGSKSIWNSYGQYGSAYATMSPFNPYSRTPPVAYDDDDDKVATVSLNAYLPGKVLSPWSLESYLRDKCDNDGGYRDRD